MDAKTWQQAKQWLIEAAALPEPERPAFLAKRCPDEAVRRELLEMLASDATLSGVVTTSTLRTGTRLGPYEIDTVIGAGGMGEVYRACDARLGRDVAIKVLPALFASDRDRLARFEREAKLLASLNHPHICTLFDVGRESSTDYIVMELVDGELLGDRLRKGPLPIDKALTYAIEIADALDKAHAIGIIHRDLKPGNVMLTKSGTKLLDFGLARSTRAPSYDVTKTGTVLGTLRYMPPEQLSGADADARSDVWAFGCVLYEMLTGRSPFDSPSEAAIAAAILGTDPPPVSSVARSVPPALQRVIDRCLAKAPDDRWQSVADLRHELEWIARSGSTGGDRAQPRTATSSRERIAWAIAAAAIVVAAATVSFAVWNASHVPAPALRYVSLPVPDGIERAGSFALSRDGLQLAFVGRPRDKSTPALIWVRPLVGQADARALPGTAGSHLPFWSMDGRKLGFFADGKLKSIDVASGVIHDLCPAPNPRGGAWGDHTILFVPDQHAGLYRVPDSGAGQPMAVTQPQGEDDLHRFPSFLADGVHFLFTEIAHGVVSIKLGSLADSEVIELHRHGSEGLGRGSTQAYVARGMLVYALKGFLLAQALDEKHWRLSDDPIVVAKSVDGDEVATQAFAVSDSTVVYRSPDRAPSQLTWFSRSGGVEKTIWDPAVFQSVHLSPDDTQAVVTRSDGSQLVMWLIGFARGTTTQELTVASSSVLWSPSGDRVLFRKPGEIWHDNIYQIRVDGSVTGELFTDQPDGSKEPIGWSDSGSLLYSVTAKAVDLWTLPTSGKPRLLIRGNNANFDFSDAAVTRKGDLIAFGGSALYVQPLRGGMPVQVANGHGACPRWRDDGRELYFVSGRRLMAADVTPGEPVTVGTPHELFDFRGTLYSPTKDGQRFLALVPQTSGERPPVNIVLNWPSLRDK